MCPCAYVHTYILCCWVVFSRVLCLQSPIVITYNKLQLPKEKHFDIGELCFSSRVKYITNCCFVLFLVGTIVGFTI